MKSYEFLREAPQNKTPKQPNPKDDNIRDEIEDLVQDIEAEEREEYIDDFKKYAGSLGKDLYSLTMLDYSGNFVDDTNSRIYNLLLDIDDPVVNKYVGLDNGDKVAMNRLIANLILNARNGKIFAYYSGKNANGFDPGDISTLINKDYIEADQRGILDKIQTAGDKYNSAMKQEKNYNPEYTRGGSDVSAKVHDAQDALLAALNSPDLPGEVKVDTSKLKPIAKELEWSKDDIQNIIKQAKADTLKANKTTKQTTSKKALGRTKR